MPILLRLFAVLFCLLGFAWDRPASAEEPTESLADFSRSGAALYVLESDGTGWKKFFKMPQIKDIGYPSVSGDGKYIAFDAWGPGVSSTQLFVVATAQNEVQMLSYGSMPSFGPDSSQMVCTFFSGGLGILKVATQEVELFHDKGWGATWSPDGKVIGYRLGPELWTYDLATKTKKMVFNGKGQFSNLYQHGAFSPDRKRFVCLAEDAEKKGRIVISFNIAGEDVDLRRHMGGPTVWAKMSWHPMQPRVVFAMRSEEHSCTQLFEFDPAKADPPKRIDGQDPTLDVKSAVWTPDGKRLFCVVRPRNEGLNNEAK